MQSGVRGDIVAVTWHVRAHHARYTILCIACLRKPQHSGFAFSTKTSLRSVGVRLHLKIPLRFITLANASAYGPANTEAVCYELANEELTATLQQSFVFRRKKWLVWEQGVTAASGKDVCAVLRGKGGETNLWRAEKISRSDKPRIWLSERAALTD